ncbi:MAG: hypothetical protein JHC92_06030 [Sphingomonadaceae bacterium]|jgi:hypothetical protein|nr:hypothetical protein [Sphingomonadaceae bacterium]
MDMILLAFYSALLLCAAYASVNGGRTGKAGSAIFIVASISTVAAARMNPNWAGTSLELFAVDAGCLLALLILALMSNRFWPIWGLGFQIVAVATHLATLYIPDVVPKSFQALLSFWAIPILLVMVAGTHKDLQYRLGLDQPSRA